jgi:glycosyltransferase involved in cell wall biosynthesis
MIQDASQKPRIAVVIPCFNHANVLRRTLDALFSQTLPPAEVVVVDDGSDDHPEEVVREFLERSPPSEGGDEGVKIIRFDKNRGAPAARNEGARVTSSPYIIFLDADSELVPTALETYIKTLEQHPEASFAYANLFWGKKAFPSRAYDLALLKKRNYIHTSSLIRREDFPGFDESIKKFQDWDLWLTMAEQGKKGAWINQFLYVVEPRRVGGISKWIPSWLHRIPWPIFGWMPLEVKKYRAAEKIIRQKHGI